jgi:hypothetical protein
MDDPKTEQIDLRQLQKDTNEHVIDQSTPAETVSPKLNKNPSKRSLFFSALAIALLLLGFVCFTLYTNWKNNPDTIFSQSLSNNLSTSLLEKQTNIQTSLGISKTIVHFDISNVKNARVAYDLSFDNQYTHQSLTMKAYADAKNSLAGAYTGDIILTSNLAPTLNKWLVLRNNGVTDAVYAQALTQPATSYLRAFPDSRLMLFGQVIFGNFSKKDRSEIMAYIMNNHIYSYTAKDVVHSTLNGRQVNIYDTTINTAKLKILNYQAAAIFGINAHELDTSTVGKNLYKVKYAKMYIDVDSKQLLRVDEKISVGSQAMTTVYSNYGVNGTIKEPIGQLKPQTAKISLDNVCFNESVYYSTSTDEDTFICHALASLQ